MTRVTRLRHTLLVYTPTLSLLLETRGRGLGLIRWYHVFVRCYLKRSRRRLFSGEVANFLHQ